MTRIPAPTFATRLAQECRTAADTLTALQDGLGQRMDPEIQEALAREMQALDGVYQTLADLALLFDGLADMRDVDALSVPASVTSLVRQRSLRARLRGRDCDLSGVSVDMF